MDCEPPGADSNWECLCSSCPPAATESEPLCCRGFHQGLFVFVSGECRCVTGLQTLRESEKAHSLVQQYTLNESRTGFSSR